VITGAARRLVLLASIVVLLEALTYVVLAVLNLRDVDSARLGSGIGVAVVLAGYGIAQLVAVRFLLRGQAPARSPLVVAHLLQILVATNLSDTPVLAIAVAGSAVVVLACLLAPPVTQALASDAR
jgi:hypothetical protein